MTAPITDQSIRLTVKDLLKIIGGLFTLFCVVGSVSLEIGMMKGDLKLELQQIQSQLQLQNAQINDRIDYIQGEIDADCFGRQDRYSKNSKMMGKSNSN